MHFKKILITILILIITIVPPALIIGSRNQAVYIIEKGCRLSYQEEGITYDSAYWMVGRAEEEIMTIVVDAHTWHLYSIGEKFVIPNRFIVYEGNVNPIGGIN